MKNKLIILLGLAAVIVIIVAVFWNEAAGRFKAQGYIAYTAPEAEALAYTKCGQCHNTDKIEKYCMRCGPPFIVVVHNMRSLIKLERERGRRGLESYTDAQAVAIAQVWDARVGNWEHTWRKQDLAKLLEGDKALLKLLDTPAKERPIEAALAGRSAPGAYKEEQSPAAPMKH